MRMNMENPVIKAQSEEEFRDLKGSYEELDNYYELRTNFGALEVSHIPVTNIISVYPHEKEAKIEDVTRRKKDLGGLLKSTSEFCLIELGDKRYDIQYKNPSNQEYSQE